MSETPTKFEDLTPTELYRSALEDFALPVEEGDKGKKKVLLAAFVEGGVAWSDYVAQHPEVAPEEPVQVKAADVITSDAPSHNTVEEKEVEVVQEIAVAQPVVQDPNQQYLIKMTRENPLYEVRGHRFTKEHPYAIVDASDADYILTKEDGFRQATPSELTEYYS